MQAPKTKRIAGKVYRLWSSGLKRKTEAVNQAKRLKKSPWNATAARAVKIGSLWAVYYRD